MLVESGFVRAITPDGSEFTFVPSFARIATLGDPQAIVTLYVGLFGADAEANARYVLGCLCEQDDPTALLGWMQPGEGTALEWHAGSMPPTEQVLIARHLMQHGIAGKARPDGKGDGKYSDRFDAAEYVSAARVHLGLSSADAEALSMTEFQAMLEMKFPEQNKKRDVPTREEYAKALTNLQEKRRG